jgi:tRNA A-37 threonylcarbamoyl transferase component Bud32
MTAVPRCVNRWSPQRVLEHRTDAPRQVIEALWTDPDGLLRSSTLVKDGDRTTIVRLDSDGRHYILKRSNLRGPLHTAIHACLRSRAQWSWINANRVIGAGLLTPQPFALLETRLGPFRARSFLLTEHIAGIAPGEWIERHAGDRGAIDDLASRFGEVWRALGRARLSHGDMKQSNFIIDPDDRIWLVDLDGMRRRRVPILFERARARDRERFLRNWKDQPEVEAAFRNRLDTP